MAKSLNISRVAYTNYELGNREPDFDTVMRISKILGVTVDYLLGNSTVRYAAQKPDGDALPAPLINIMLSAAHLSRESCDDLQKYVQLLKIKDESKNWPNAGSAGRDVVTRRRRGESAGREGGS